METIIVVLTLILVKPANQPDIVGRIPMDTVEECWTAAREWVDKGLTQEEKALGAVGVGAACTSNRPAIEI